MTTPVQQQLLTQMQHPNADPIQRAAAGRELAEIGDPRPEVMTLVGMQFCYVPQGLFWQGSSGRNDRQARQDEKPPSHYDIPYAYWMGRFPVTTAQFQAFIDDNGYKDEQWWSAAIAAGHWSEAGFLIFEGAEPRQVSFLYDPSYVVSNHPVIGVSWYECLAFAEWLTVRWRGLGYLSSQEWVALPNEPEWEKAARGGAEILSTPIVRYVHDRTPLPAIEMMPNPEPRRRYPYGNKPDPRKGNYEETGIEMTNVVGIFAVGASPYGCEEMSGNVGEWTRSVWTWGYPYEPEFETMTDSLITRVTRGGAFSQGAAFGRCAHRGWFDPRSGDRTYGMRLAIVGNAPAARTPLPQDWRERDWIPAYEPLR